MSWWIGLVDASGTSEVQSDGRCVSKYMRKYLARTDALGYVDEPAVAAAVGITRGSPLSADPNAICYSAAIDQGPAMTRAPFQARFATYHFSTDAPLPDADDDDPTTRRTITSQSPVDQSRYEIFDINGELIVNTAGTPYDGGIPCDVCLGTITKTRNVDAAGFDADDYLEVNGSLNSDTYMGKPPGTLRVKRSYIDTYQGAFHFMAETYVFEFDINGWQPKITSAGFFQRNAYSANPDAVMEITNGDLDPDAADPDKRVPEPEPLDEFGYLVPPGPANRPSGCFRIEVNKFPTMAFSSFGL